MSLAAEDSARDAGGGKMTLTLEDTTMDTECLSDLESALRSSSEKNRNFLGRMKELTQLNRLIGDQNKELKEDNDRLVSELSMNKTVTERLREEVDECRSDRSVLASLQTEAEDLRKQIHLNGLTIQRLTTACEEKNRRIDLLANRRYQRQKGGESWREGCDGYRSNESPSADSESSASIATTSDELTCEDLFLAEDFQLRYRRLLNEKLALEKVHSEAQLLLSQLKEENKDYQNKIKALTDSLQELKDELCLAEICEEDLRVKLEEVQVENEQLEFQVLEMEVQKEEELERSRDPSSQKSSTVQTPSKISNSSEIPMRPLAPDLEETTEAQPGPKRLMEEPGTSSDNDFTHNSVDLGMNSEDKIKNFLEDEESISSEETFSRLPPRRSVIIDKRSPGSSRTGISDLEVSIESVVRYSGDFALCGVSDPWLSGNNSLCLTTEGFYPREKDWMTTGQDLEGRLRRNCSVEDVVHQPSCSRGQVRHECSGKGCLSNEEIEEGRDVPGYRTYREAGLLRNDFDHDLLSCGGRSQMVDGISVDWSKEEDFRSHMEDDFCERHEKTSRNVKDRSGELESSDQDADGTGDPLLYGILDPECSSDDDGLRDFYRTVHISEDVNQNIDNNNTQDLTKHEFRRELCGGMKGKVEQLGRAVENASQAQTTKAGGTDSLQGSKWKMHYLQETGKVSPDCQRSVDRKSNSADTSEMSYSPTDFEELFGAEDSLSRFEEKYFSDICSWKQLDSSGGTRHDCTSVSSDTDSFCDSLTENSVAVKSTFYHNNTSPVVAVYSRNFEQCCLEQSAMEDNCTNLNTTDDTLISALGNMHQSSFSAENSTVHHPSNTGNFTTHCFLLKRRCQERRKQHSRKLDLSFCEAANSGEDGLGSQSADKPQTLTARTSGDLGHTSAGLDKAHARSRPSELSAMITPPESKSLKFHGLNPSNGTMAAFRDGFEFHDKSIDSDDSLWAAVEDPENAVNRGPGRSMEFWKEVEERMGFNVDDITLILEFEDSFPNDEVDDDASARHTSPDSAPLSDHDYDSFSLPPPLPLSSPPVAVERDSSPSERSLVEASQDVGDTKYHDSQQVDVMDSHDLQRADVMDSQNWDVLQESGVEPSAVESKAKSKSSSTLFEVTSDDQLLHWIDGATSSDLHDDGEDLMSCRSEIVLLKRMIVDLERQLSAAQDECLAVIRSRENLSGDFDHAKKIIEEKDREMKSSQKEFERLLVERNAQMAAKANRGFLISAWTQTEDDEDFAKLERLLQAKDRELTAKANEADSLSREMREWQRKVTMAAEKDTEVIKELDSTRKELESMTQKELEARTALDEVLDRERRLQVEKDRLEESVASLQVEVGQKEVIAREKETIQRRMEELEQDLRLKVESERSLLREIGSLKHRVDDLQSSLKLLQEKELDFQTLEQKYENLGSLTRRLQTAVAPMKARIARLVLRCKTKDELIRKMLKALRRHGNGESSLDAEVEREVMGPSTDDYMRPLSPLTISHLDQINHEILKLDLMSKDNSFPSLSIPPSSYNNVFGSFPGNTTLRDTANDIRQTSVTTESQATQYVNDNTATHLVSMSSRRHVTLLDDSDDVMLRDRTRTDDFANNLDYRSSSVAKISKEKTEDGRFSAGKGHEFGGFLPGKNSVGGVIAMDERLSNAFSIPDPPIDFHVEKVSGNGSVLLGWTPPVTGDLAHSRSSSTVAGYKVYVNGRETLFVGSHLATKVLLRSLNLNAVPLQFSLRTVTERGDTSRPVDLCLDDALLRKLQTNDFVEESVASDEVAMSSATSSPSRRDVNGHRKMFLAIYDYHPAALARIEGQGAELSFQMGDIIVTYGPMRSDGYYVGKVRGRRGLVPGSFIEELAPFTSQDLKIVTSNDRPQSGLISTNGIHLNNRRSRSVSAGRNMPQSKAA